MYSNPSLLTYKHMMIVFYLFISVVCNATALSVTRWNIRLLYGGCLCAERGNRQSDSNQHSYSSLWSTYSTYSIVYYNRNAHNLWLENTSSISCPFHVPSWAANGSNVPDPGSNDVPLRPNLISFSGLGPIAFISSAPCAQMTKNTHAAPATVKLIRLSCT